MTDCGDVLGHCRYIIGMLELCSSCDHNYGGQEFESSTFLDEGHFICLWATFLSRPFLSPRHLEYSETTSPIH